MFIFWNPTTGQIGQFSGPSLAWGIKVAKNTFKMFNEIVQQLLNNFEMCKKKKKKRLISLHNK